jgi:hypothetical protein
MEIEWKWAGLLTETTKIRTPIITDTTKMRIFMMEDNKMGRISIIL